jgi:hypothetical protein
MRKEDEFMIAVVCFVMMAVLSLTAAVCNAQVPEAQWNRETRLWLARGVVAEAGWTSEREHTAMAYVLRRRWRAIHRKEPSVTFLMVIRQYMRGLSPNRRPTRRMTWVRSLPEDGVTRPDGWVTGTKGAPWGRYAKHWDRVLSWSMRWQAGRIADPCPLADHWGAPHGIDLVRARRAGWPSVSCGETANVFYSTKGVRNGS